MITSLPSGRIAIYEDMHLDWISFNSNSKLGFCYWFDQKGLFSFDIQSRLPELYEQKPPYVKDWWWDKLDRESRIKALERAISLCKENGGNKDNNQRIHR